MEVKAFNLAIVQPHHLPVDARMLDAEMMAFLPGSNRNNQVKLEDVMMDLEEVKNFLYMVVGGGVHVKHDEKLGSVVNKLA